MSDALCQGVGDQKLDEQMCPPLQPHVGQRTFARGQIDGLGGSKSLAKRQRVELKVALAGPPRRRHRALPSSVAFEGLQQL